MDRHRYKERDRSLRTLGFSSYDEYLRSPIWHWIRARTLRRAKGVCKGCHINRATAVHHERYSVAALLGIDWRSLVAVCAMCHEMAHAAELDKSRPSSPTEAAAAPVERPETWDARHDAAAAPFWARPAGRGR